MNKNELIDAVATELRRSKHETEAFVNIFLGIISEEISQGKRVQLTGFGTFERRLKDARKGRNPRTGELLQIAARYYPVFKPGKNLKEQCN